MDKTKIGRDSDNPVGFIHIEGEDILAGYGWGLPKLCYDDDILNMNCMLVYGTLFTELRLSLMSAVTCEQ